MEATFARGFKSAKNYCKIKTMYTNNNWLHY